MKMDVVVEILIGVRGAELTQLEFCGAKTLPGTAAG